MTVPRQMRLWWFWCMARLGMGCSLTGWPVSSEPQPMFLFPICAAMDPSRVGAGTSIISANLRMIWQI